MDQDRREASSLAFDEQGQKALSGSHQLLGADGPRRRAGPHLIPALLRESAGMHGEVAVIGHLEEYLEVWSLERLREPMAQPFPDEDMDTLGGLGI